MDRQTRICLWVIVLGLANFVGYTIGYVAIGGDAMNGKVRRDADPDASWHYFISRDGEDVAISRGQWIYSAVHSISVWPTVGAVLLAMLTLAKERIVSSLRSTILHGRTVMTVLATLIAFISIVMTVWFVLHTIRHLTDPKLLGAATAGMVP